MALTCSPLATWIDCSSDRWSVRDYSISKITIHHAAGVCTPQDFSNIIKSSRQVSYNYAIANDGTICSFIPEERRAWTTGVKGVPDSVKNDHMAITIEVSNCSGAPDWKVSDAALKSLIKLCEDICKRRGIKCLTYTGDYRTSSLTRHDWFAATQCPGPYLASKFPYICNTVNDLLGDPTRATYTAIDCGSSFATQSMGIAVSQDMVNIDAIDPFVATISRKTKKIDTKKLSEIGVVGIVLEAGYLYDGSHNKVSYKNPNLPEQMKQITESKIEWGFYHTARARSQVEARSELYELSFIIRKYPPALGVWLQLDLTKSVSVNNKIIDVYEKEFNRLGLKHKVGFYVTRKQLEQITWKDYYDRWNLWLIDHTDDLDNIKDKVNPEFFMLNEGE